MNAQTLSFLALLGMLSSACTTTVLPSDHPPEKHLTKLVGEGRLSHPPQYIELTVTVKAQCHPTPLAASQAADNMATKIMTLLRGKINAENSQDGVLSDGGYTQPYQRYIRSGLTVCRGTFQKTSTIVMKTSRLATFSSDYLAIQQMVFSNAMGEPVVNAKETPITFAAIGIPTRQLYHKTRERLEQQALANAVENAQKKFSASAKIACGKPKYGIMKFVETSPTAARPIAYGAQQGPSRANSTNGPIALDVIWINKLLDVYFTIAPDSCRADS